MQLQEAEGSCSSKNARAGDGWAAALRQAIGWTGRSAVLTTWLRRTRLPPVRHNPRWRRAVNNHRSDVTMSRTRRRTRRRWRTRRGMRGEFCALRAAARRWRGASWCGRTHPHLRPHPHLQPHHHPHLHPHVLMYYIVV